MAQSRCQEGMCQQTKDDVLGHMARPARRRQAGLFAIGEKLALLQAKPGEPAFRSETAALSPRSFSPKHMQWFEPGLMRRKPAHQAVVFRPDVKTPQRVKRPATHSFVEQTVILREPTPAGARLLDGRFARKLRGLDQRGRPPVPA